MKARIPVIILAGGFGTRISEETEIRPKPMVLLEGKPILWHLLNIYANQGFTNFIIATGYKHEMIDEWVKSNNRTNGWDFDGNVETLFTGLETPTGGRVRQVIEGDSSDQFMMTYGDGLGNVSLTALHRFHNSHGKIATVTSVRPPARFGHIQSDSGVVTQFGEKNQADVGWINGGFFVLNSEVVNYIQTDGPFEQAPMTALVEKKELMTFQHFGFWQPMDTLREKKILENLAKLPVPPWQQVSI
jgi:glucose-1-phosphate cytidylyltransferase